MESPGFKPNKPVKALIMTHKKENGRITCYMSMHISPPGTQEIYIDDKGSALIFARYHIVG